MKTVVKWCENHAKSYDFLKSHCEIVAQWKTALFLCTKPLISKPDSIRTTERIQELNKQSHSPSDLFRLHQHFNQLDHLYRDHILVNKIQIFFCESQFQYV